MCQSATFPYVFERLDVLVIHHTFRADLMLRALSIDVCVFTAAVWGFLRFIDRARATGSLSQMGE